jgi:hypothetical protein
MKDPPTATIAYGMELATDIDVPDGLETFSINRDTLLRLLTEAGYKPAE